MVRRVIINRSIPLTFPGSFYPFNFSSIYTLPSILFASEISSTSKLQISSISADELAFSSIQAKLHSEDENSSRFKHNYDLFCYPDGDCKGNQGYITWMFKEKHNHLKNCTINITISIRDSDGNCRFPQSLALVYEDNFPYGFAADQKTYHFERYLKRDTLVSPDFMCNGLLFVVCDIYFYPHRGTVLLDELRQKTSYTKVTDIYRDRNHPLRAILSELSPFYKTFFGLRPHALIPIDANEENEALRKMARLILDGGELFFADIVDAYDFYKFTDKYIIPKFKQKCRDYLKSQICSENTLELILLSDLCSDKDLKTFSTEYLLYYSDADIFEELWCLLQQERPDLAAEIYDYNSARVERKLEYCRQKEKE